LPNRLHNAPQASYRKLDDGRSLQLQRLEAILVPYFFWARRALPRLLIIRMSQKTRLYTQFTPISLLIASHRSHAISRSTSQARRITTSKTRNSGIRLTLWLLHSVRGVELTYDLVVTSLSTNNSGVIRGGRSTPYRSRLR